MRHKKTFLPCSRKLKTFFNLKYQDFVFAALKITEWKNFLKFIFSVRNEHRRKFSCILITLIFTCDSQVFQNIDIFHLSESRLQESFKTKMKQHKLQKGMKEMWKHESNAVWQISYLKQHGSEEVNCFSLCKTA